MWSTEACASRGLVHLRGRPARPGRGERPRLPTGRPGPGQRGRGADEGEARRQSRAWTPPRWTWDPSEPATGSGSRRPRPQQPKRRSIKTINYCGPLQLHQPVPGADGLVHDQQRATERYREAATGAEAKGPATLRTLKPQRPAVCLPLLTDCGPDQGAAGPGRAPRRCPRAKPPGRPRPLRDTRLIDDAAFARACGGCSAASQGCSNGYLCRRLRRNDVGPTGCGKTIDTLDPSGSRQRQHFVEAPRSSELPRIDRRKPACGRRQHAGPEEAVRGA